MESLKGRCGCSTGRCARVHKAPPSRLMGFLPASHASHSREKILDQGESRRTDEQKNRQGLGLLTGLRLESRGNMKLLWPMRGSGWGFDILKLVIGATN